MASEIFEEGLRIPPVKIVREGQLDESLCALILQNVRTPDERMGDLMAQIGANRIGILRLRQLMEQDGVEVWRNRWEQLMRYSETITRAVLREIPPGEYSFTDYLDDDGRGQQNLPICVRVIVPASSAGTIRFDFTGSAPQTAGSLNAPPARDAIGMLLCGSVPDSDGSAHQRRLLAACGSVRA
ncbi:MAG: hypothetical protein KatS3mg021_1710 [Fimbriimonadales bacterium]|nr:MAG: hypothetical protein KatS3mg021_1710 [Fimbriimonadales bacterium]